MEGSAIASMASPAPSTARRHPARIGRVGDRERLVPVPHLSWCGAKGPYLGERAMVEVVAEDSAWRTADVHMSGSEKRGKWDKDG